MRLHDTVLTRVLYVILVDSYLHSLHADVHEYLSPCTADGKDRLEAPFGDVLDAQQDHLIESEDVVVVPERSARAFCMRLPQSEYLRVT